MGGVRKGKGKSRSGSGDQVYSVYYGQEACGRIVSRSVIWSNVVLKVTSRTGKETGRNCWDNCIDNPGEGQWGPNQGWGERPGPRAPSEQVGCGRGRGYDGFLPVGLLLAKIREVRRGKLEAVGAPGGLIAFSVESKMRLSRGFEFKPGGVRAWSADMVGGDSLRPHSLRKSLRGLCPLRGRLLRAAGAPLRL